MRPTSDQPLPNPAGGATSRRLGRATAIAAAALAGVAPGAARADVPLAETSLAPTGSLAGDGARRPQPLVRVVDVAPDGTRGQAITVSDRSRPARLVGETQARGGAVAVAFDQQLGDGRWEPRIAFRPAGAASFLPAFATGPARPDTNTPAQLPVVLGPDGTGVVLGSGGAHRDSYVRRLAADGSLGPAIVVAPRAIGDVALEAEFGPSGAVVIAIAARTPVLTGDPDGAAYEAGVYATTLPAGATRTTALQHLAASENPGDEIPEIELTVGEDDYAVLEAGLFEPARVATFEGPATALAPSGA